MKILVATDLSAASKTGIRFAINLAKQHKCKLTFLYTYTIEKPVSWSSKVYESYSEEERQKNLEALTVMVASLAKSMHAESKSFEFLVRESADASMEILNYALKNRFDFICVGTRGAGMVRQIFGTHSSWLIQHSKIPVICVPQTYRSSKIKNILYASDLTDLKREMEVVADFNKSLKANLAMVHFDLNSERSGFAAIGGKELKILEKQNTSIFFENESNGFLPGMKKIISHLNPSILILFTTSNRSIVSEVMHESLSAEFSFGATIPMVVFSKNRHK
jgi:nucleotide-binding universal stress UspA family protein